MKYPTLDMFGKPLHVGDTIRLPDYYPVGQGINAVIVGIDTSLSSPTIAVDSDYNIDGTFLHRARAVEVVKLPTEWDYTEKLLKTLPIKSSVMSYKKRKHQ
jgi:hypothetical protein